MHALVDDRSIIVSEGEACVLISVGDPAYAPVRHYLVDERGGDFEAVCELVRKLSQSTAARYGLWGVRIEAICPGFIKKLK